MLALWQIAWISGMNLNETDRWLILLEEMIGMSNIADNRIGKRMTGTKLVIQC